MKKRFEVEAATLELAYRIAMEMAGEEVEDEVRYIQEVRLVGSYASGSSWMKYREVKITWEFEVEY